MERVQHTGPLDGGDLFSLFLLFITNMYFSIREWMQIATMRRIGLFQQYMSDAWNAIDIISSGLLFLATVLSLPAET
jgi:hypothetical protein